MYIQHILSFAVPPHYTALYRHVVGTFAHICRFPRSTLVSANGETWVIKSNITVFPHSFPLHYCPLQLCNTDLYKAGCYWQNSQVLPRICLQIINILSTKDDGKSMCLCAELIWTVLQQSDVYCRACNVRKCGTTLLL